jgi:hypothetical protein
MKAPVTQEELDYRDNFTNRVNAVSNAQGLFNDVEDRARKLTILKSLISTLHLGDDVLAILQAEIEAADEAARKAKEAEEAEAAAALEAETSSSIDEPTADESDDANLDLTPMPDDELVEEGLDSEKEDAVEEKEDSTILLEEADLFEDSNDLPTPEEADNNIDFTENY